MVGQVLQFDRLGQVLQFERQTGLKWKRIGPGTIVIRRRVGPKTAHCAVPVLPLPRSSVLGPARGPGPGPRSSAGVYWSAFCTWSAGHRPCRRLPSPRQGTPHHHVTVRHITTSLCVTSSRHCASHHRVTVRHITTSGYATSPRHCASHHHVTVRHITTSLCVTSPRHCASRHRVTVRHITASLCVTSPRHCASHHHVTVRHITASLYVTSPRHVTRMTYDANTLATGMKNRETTGNERPARTRLAARSSRKNEIVKELGRW